MKAVPNELQRLNARPQVSHLRLFTVVVTIVGAVMFFFGTDSYFAVASSHMRQLSTKKHTSKEARNSNSPKGEVKKWLDGIKSDGLKKQNEESILTHKCKQTGCYDWIPATKHIANTPNGDQAAKKYFVWPKQEGPGFSETTEVTGSTPQMWHVFFPPHSGTDTFYRFFKTELNVSTCAHHHNFHHYQKPGCPSFFYVLLSGNPYRRVITSAAWRGHISGGKKNHTNYARIDEINAFRSFVNRAKKPPVTPTSGIFKGEPPMGAHPHFIVRTNHLQEDTLQLLDILGYPKKTFQQVHCISSCHEVGHRVEDIYIERLSPEEELEKKHAENRQKIEMYDRETAKKVQNLFKNDFEQFHFSLEVEDMFL